MTTPEETQNFGVMFTKQNDPSHLVTFLQKPSPDRIRELAGDYIFMVDVGVWLLSKRAIRLLMNRSGWNDTKESFNGENAAPYDLYGKWGLHLGEKPCEPDDEISQLTTAIVPIPSGGFYHFSKSPFCRLLPLENRSTSYPELRLVSTYTHQFHTLILLRLLQN